MHRSHMMCVAVLLSRQTWWRIQNLKVTKNFSYPTGSRKIIVTVNLKKKSGGLLPAKGNLILIFIHIISNLGVTRYVMLQL